MCEYAPDGYAEVFKKTKRKARKQHRCGECGGHILAADSYIYCSGIFEGEPFDGKWCLACDASRVEFAKEHHGSPGIGDLAETLRECMEESPDLANAVHWGRHLVRLRRRRLAAKAVTP